MEGDVRRLDPEYAFALMKNCFERAVAARPGEVSEFSLTFADRPARLRFVGRELARHIIRPIAHLKHDATPPHGRPLRIDLWDENATGLVFRRYLDSDNIISHRVEPGSSAGRFSLNHHQNATLCFDPESSRLVGCFRSAEGLSLYQRGRPLHVPLTLWHNAHDIPVVHAGLVARDGVGVLFAGPAGSGKSTAAVTCLLNGFGFFSDDLIGLDEAADGSFRGHSLYNSTYFDGTHLRRFPILAPHAVESPESNEDKLLVLLHDVFPSRIERSTGIHVIALPQVGDETRSTFRPESPAKALLALAPPSLGINRNLGSSEFHKLGRLAERIPAFQLRLGRDLDGIAPVVEKMIQQVGSRVG